MLIVLKSNKSNLPKQERIFHLKEGNKILCGIDKRFKGIYRDDYGRFEDNPKVKLCRKCQRIKNSKK